MFSLVASFLVCFLICSFIIYSKESHAGLTGDHDLSGPQKFHSGSVPRIGGLGIAVGVSLGIVSREIIQQNGMGIEEYMLLSACPVFLVGLVEDLTKRAAITVRAAFTALGAFIAALLMSSIINRIDIPLLDTLLEVPTLSLIITVFAVTGVTNAYNIIDGFNGLSSMVGMIALLALGYLGVTLHDSEIAFLSFVMAGAILGFLVLNYPRGLIFLGDGGAYLIGFWIAVLSVLMVARHAEVSPWFALMINGYPILETLFTIYRRWIHQGKNPGHPDGIHFHSLIYRRLLNRRGMNTISASSQGSNAGSLNHSAKPLDSTTFNANARTSPYLWLLSSLSVIPTVLWWQTTWVLMICALLFTLFYLWLYTSIVRFKTPKWMHPIR
jgi:UDP-N-acetylmuramyl pentapeptide phosphotransferase/UDP-N-acetylglucosamine-1-phosphate transferase